MKQFARIFVLLPLLLSLPNAAQAAPVCFPEAAPVITNCVDGRIAAFWQQNGGLSVFGYPIGPQSALQIEDRSVENQPFERNRLELHPENVAPYDVLLGRLGADMLAKQGRDWQGFPKADPGAPHFFPETGHAIAPQFWNYWSNHGLEFDRRTGTSFAESLALFGLPLSEAQVEVSPSNGQPYLTQWFERARFELHPENAGTPYEVLLGLLQRELSGNGDAPATLPPAAPPAAQSSGRFIRVSGSQLTLDGQPIVLKGINYYPQWWPWTQMWTAWDGPKMERELRLGRDKLGINVVRILLAYNWSATRDGAGQVTPKIVGRIREIAQMAGDLDMRVLITLFDFSHDFPGPGTSVEREHIAYLRALVPEFANDDRILGWDVHNEPDNYNVWQDNPQKVLRWTGRIADELHALAPNQLVTVGMGKTPSLLLPGPDGRRVIEYSDFVSVHAYDAGAVGRDLDTVRAQTGKPIVVEEFGWPSGPACMLNYTEAVQAGLYRDVVSAAQARNMGVIGWTLRDFDSARTSRWDSREEHFGLFRPDDSLKPAAQELARITAQPLPSAVNTHTPLTTNNPNLPSGNDAPVLVPESGHTVKGLFRRAYDLMGGRESFGLPLTEAFERQPDKRVVQYFENVVLEYYPSDFPRGTPDTDKVMRALRPVPVGQALIAGRNLPPSDGNLQGLFRDFYEHNYGSWRLGAPLTAEVNDIIDGQPTVVQYFEKGVLYVGAGNTVRLLPTGQHAWSQVCSAAG